MVITRKSRDMLMTVANSGPCWKEQNTTLPRYPEMVLCSTFNSDHTFQKLHVFGYSVETLPGHAVGTGRVVLTNK